MLTEVDLLTEYADADGHLPDQDQANRIDRAQSGLGESASMLTYPFEPIALVNDQITVIDLPVASIVRTVGLDITIRYVVSGCKGVVNRYRYTTLGGQVKPHAISRRSPRRPQFDSITSAVE